MGLEIITDALIDSLLKTPKMVENPNARRKSEFGHVRTTYIVVDNKNNRFNLYLRQNYKPGMEDAFSCGLSYLLPSGETFTLVRYNGGSHDHSNKLENERLGHVAHIHKASRRYLDETGKSDGYAESTNRFRTLEGALDCLVRDCNISGFDTSADAPTLF